jgi:hypothetical protein
LQDEVDSAEDIGRLTIGSFAGCLIDTHFVAVPGGNIQAPALVDRTAGSGSVLGFSFLGPPLGSGLMEPGQISVPLIVYTNSHVVAATNAFVNDGSAIAVEFQELGRWLKSMVAP